MSNFDPSQFLDSTTTEALTKRPPLPVGDYVGTITDIQIRPWESKKPDAKVKSGYAADLKIDVDVTAYPDALAVVGVPKVTLTPGIMLDCNDSGAIDWSAGKNGSLRRYREALNMNVAGQAFSLRQMAGRMIRVKIKHRLYEGESYDEVDSVAKA
jgi:hypothetical protein